ncbi:MAG: 30S ribosomal protein S2 [Lentisphaeria bacterium]|nr:30S ribosomal protein S2 [Lentisphaeria bacterium]
MAKITITDLLEAGVHFGHQTRRWNPKMKKYIYGTRSGITIFDLGKTMKQLAAACDFLTQTAANGGQILFVGAKRQAQETVRAAAESVEMPYMCDRWLGGTLTNSKVVQTRVAAMKKLQAQSQDGTFEKMPKKQVAGLKRELAKLQTALGGIANMPKLPAAVVVIDVDREHIAVQEAIKLNIPVVALVDSNCNPDGIDYVVPGNDDALRSIKVIVSALQDAVMEGKAMAGKKKAAAKAAEEEAAAAKADKAEAAEAPAEA